MKHFRAFTLVELLIAMGVTSLLVVAMMRLFMEETSLWQKYDQKLDTFREARAAMQMMARDFSGLRPEANAPADYPILALTTHPDTLPADKVNQEIYGLPTAHNKGSNDICAIGYYCTWSDTKKAFVLQRQFTESSTTFNLMKPDATTKQQSSGLAAFTTIFDRKQDPTVQTIDGLATYVWDLKVVTPDPGTPTQTLTGYFNRELPPWIEIRFKALGINAARKIAGSPVTRDIWFQPDSSLYHNLILPGEQQFVTRIKLCR